MVIKVIDAPALAAATFAEEVSAQVRDCYLTGYDPRYLHLG